jgi:hypothetical protein
MQCIYCGVYWRKKSRQTASAGNVSRLLASVRASRLRLFVARPNSQALLLRGGLGPLTFGCRIC